MPHQVVVPEEGDKAFYCQLSRPLFLELRDLAHQRGTSLKVLAHEAFTEYLERQGRKVA